jgi:hypothetical protein
MMFDTKTTSPLPTATAASNPQCYLQVNKYIPSEQSPAANAVAVATPVKDKFGRDLYYEPSLFFSPVLASERIVDERRNVNYNDSQSNKNSTTPDKKRLMTAEGVDSLTSQLDALCLGGSTSSWNNKKPFVATVITPTAPASPKSVMTPTARVKFENETKDNEHEGRFDQSFYSPKTRCHVTVKRSCRLASLAIE